MATTNLDITDLDNGDTGLPKSSEFSNGHPVEATLEFFDSFLVGRRRGASRGQGTCDKTDVRLEGNLTRDELILLGV